MKTKPLVRAWKGGGEGRIQKVQERGRSVSWSGRNPEMKKASKVSSTRCASQDALFCGGCGSNLPLSLHSVVNGINKTIKAKGQHMRLDFSEREVGI